MNPYDKLMGHLAEHDGHMHIYTTVDPAKWWVLYAWSDTPTSDPTQTEASGDTLEVAMGLVVLEVVGA